MQQRQPRLGDILDDYCPRERRITNHAVVAMVGHDVKQTRCTTCDAEHEYKQAKVPSGRRRKELTQALQRDPGATRRSPEGATSPSPPSDEVIGEGVDQASEVPESASGSDNGTDAPRLEAQPPLAAREDGGDGDEPHPNPDDNGNLAEEDGPVHRRLIRATLPRQEGQVQARQMPDFTVRSPGTRPGGFRGGQFRPGARGVVSAPGRAPGGGKGPRTGAARHDSQRGCEGFSDSRQAARRIEPQRAPFASRAWQPAGASRQEALEVR
jgi:hypothetical protein